MEVLTALWTTLCSLNSPYYTLLCHSFGTLLEHPCMCVFNQFVLSHFWSVRSLSHSNQSVELLLLCCLSLAFALPNSRQQHIPCKPSCRVPPLLHLKSTSDTDNSPQAFSYMWRFFDSVFKRNQQFNCIYWANIVFTTHNSICRPYL